MSKLQQNQHMVDLYFFVYEVVVKKWGTNLKHIWSQKTSLAPQMKGWRTKRKRHLKVNILLEVFLYEDNYLCEVVTAKWGPDPGLFNHKLMLKQP